MNPLRATQVEFNLSSRDRWELFRTHREQVTDLLRAGSGRLLVLGAGNCNDLDLAALAHRFASIALVDLDGEALLRGVVAQGCANSSAISLYGDIDVTGRLEALHAWANAPLLSEPDLGSCIERPLEVLAAFSGGFDVVASVCLLSQLVLSVVRSTGEQHPNFIELVRAIRLGHLRLLTSLLAPHGTGVLISDVVSSASAPHLPSLPEATFAHELTQMIDAGNHFHGVNPFVVEACFRSDPVLARETSDVRLLRPWRWQFSAKRTYAVWAIRYCRGGGVPTQFSVPNSGQP